MDLQNQWNMNLFKCWKIVTTSRMINCEQTSSHLRTRNISHISQGIIKQTIENWDSITDTFSDIIKVAFENLIFIKNLKFWIALQNIEENQTSLRYV